MRKSEAINFLNLKLIKSSSNNTGPFQSVYIPLDKKLNSYSYPELKQLSQIQYEDDILDFHLLKENQSDTQIKTLLIGKSNKCITIFNGEGQKENEFIHYKKITNSILIQENGRNYLLFSDKFGEIYIKKLNTENFNEAPKSLYGHSDPIHFMKISPSRNLIASADILGKIKICEFPNVFNTQSVLFYENEDVKFMDFFPKSDKELVVLNSKHFLHFWSMENYKLSSKIPLERVLLNNKQVDSGLNTQTVEIVSISPFDRNMIYVESKENYYILEKVEDDVFKRKEVKKEKDEGKSFFLENQNKILRVDLNGNVFSVVDLN